jgi:hypothetical protein
VRLNILPFQLIVKSLDFSVKILRLTGKNQWGSSWKVEREALCFFNFGIGYLQDTGGDVKKEIGDSSRSHVVKEMQVCVEWSNEEEP